LQPPFHLRRPTDCDSLVHATRHTTQPSSGIDSSGPGVDRHLPSTQALIAALTAHGIDPADLNDPSAA
jgi:hypothetical protein